MTTSAYTALMGCPEPLTARYDAALLDLDGVVYVGRAAVPAAESAIRAARACGVRVAFVTNNASRPPERVAAHLSDLGIPASAGDVVTSAQAAAVLLAARLPPGCPVLVVGGEGLRTALEAVGLLPVATLAEEPRAVVQGFSPDVGWRLLAEGAYAVASGVPWLATNTDLTVPTGRGLAPGNGTLVAAIAAATGQRPEVAGKPQAPLFEQAAARSGAVRPLVVGDRLDTDIEGARAARMPSLAVLTGVATPHELLLAPPQQRPTYLGADLDALLHPHPGPVTDGSGRWRCRDAVVEIGPAGSCVVQAGDDDVDILRAACAGAWATWPDSAADPQALAAVTAPLMAALRPRSGAVA